VGIACLQVVLDKGQREDWFSSAFIVKLAVVAFICLVTFIIVELKSSEPVLNLREFKDSSFASANVIQCVAFFVLFGSIVLLPLFLQQLMGYNAFLAGMALAPGGIATLITMPIIGQLVTKINPKGILMTGLLVVAYSMVLMTRFNLSIDFEAVIWSRIVMGVGLGMVFIPLTSMAFATIPKEEMGNATSIFNLLRNIAGSFGIALMTTLLARRAQFHQFRLTEQLNPFDANYQMASYKAMKILQAKTGIATHAGANGLIYQKLMREATLFSFTDTFYASVVIVICILPLVFILKRSKGGGASGMMH
jgi:DHA2 family multidrug resistance protein